MGRWQAATLQNSFGKKTRIAPVAPAPFEVGGPRVIPSGIKVWPVKGKDIQHLWSAAPVVMARNFHAANFHVIPANNKFSRFRDLNVIGQHLYLITMFASPKPDTDYASTGMMIFGFIVDLNRTTPVSA